MAGNKSRCRNLINGHWRSVAPKALTEATGERQGYKFDRSQKTIMVQDSNWEQMRALPAVASAKAGVRVHQPLQNCLGCRGKGKKCDKLINPIVRVGNSDI